MGSVPEGTVHMMFVPFPVHVGGKVDLWDLDQVSNATPATGIRMLLLEQNQKQAPQIVETWRDIR